MIYAALITMALIAIYSGFKRKMNFQKFELWYLLPLFVVSIVANFLLLKTTLFHSRYVPGHLKDGMYGFIGGASFGAIIINLMISSFLLGLLLSYIGKRNTEAQSIKKIETAPTQSRFPDWFNRLSHSLSGCIIGSAFGIAFLNIFKDKPLEDIGGLAIGSIIGAAGIYSLAGIVVIIQKILNRT
jgi:F0F1-type ATP synthase assembly protein I